MAGPNCLRCEAFKESVALQPKLPIVSDFHSFTFTWELHN